MAALACISRVAYAPRVDEVRYQCSDRARRQSWLVTLLAPPLLAVASAALFSLKGGFTITKMAVLAPIIWVVILPFMISVMGRMLGSTTVNRAGIRTRTLVNQQSLRWDEVTALEVYEIPGRGASGGFVLQAHQAARKPLDLPGVFATPSQVNGTQFVGTVEAIKAAWRDASGREQVAGT